MGPLRIGVDDTDSPDGGCTTWVLTELLRAARDLRVDLIGEPRLVRLNPNVPWKTRGNAALSARFGRGSGRRTQVAEIEGRPVYAHARGGALSRGERDRLVDAAWACVLRCSPGAFGTDPALVASDRSVPAAFYWDAVREVLDPAETHAALTASGAETRFRGDRRGLVGAAAAIAWPGRRATWELIAYRSPARWGTKRAVDAGSVRDAQRQHPELFLCTDRRTRRVLVTPHTPCPTLYGLRAVSARAARAARRVVRSEPVDRWAVFRTNQGSGDHLVVRTAASFGPFLSGSVDGVVVRPPEVHAGAHVALALRDLEDQELSCVAFEPTKTLPPVVRSLRVGDRVRVWGSRGVEPTVRLEGIRLLRLVPRYRLRNPTCAPCRRSARSLGRARGFRCPNCGRRFPPETVVRVLERPTYAPGVYHPTPSARRHLAPRAAET